jgi:hypothetical protein
MLASYNSAPASYPHAVAVWREDALLGSLLVFVCCQCGSTTVLFS